MATDFELLDAWSDGDRVAAEELFERHFKSVYRFFRNKVDGGAEDLVQQTFLACIEGRERFERKASFRTYLFATARYVLLEEFRQRKKQAQIDFEHSSLQDLGVSPTGILVRKGEQRILLEALRRLPLDYQLAIELFHFEGLKGADLAEVLGIPHNTVRSRLSRARELLRKEVEDIADSKERLESTMANLDDWAKSLREFLDPTPA